MTSRGSQSFRSARLHCQDLSVRRGQSTVLHDITLTLRADECLSLIGPNGSGKTTLMLTLLGLLRPACGRVLLDEADMHALPARVRGRFAAYVPQVVERIPAFTVREVVAGGRYPHVAPLQPLGPVDQAAVQAALDQCRLADLATRPVNALSGGERQKTLIAAAIAQDAQIMFLDEPNTALDPAYQVELVALLQRWSAAGRGLVLISHDLQLPAAFGGRVVALHEGRVAADGPVAGILEPARLEQIYQTTFETAVTTAGRKLVVPVW
ncbi:MAG: ABC transporter ATP-binding protein [Planctomycetes bacterium]|nr:ABC transporter ATP-binding protein [Planctomycetota bacterium]